MIAKKYILLPTLKGIRINQLSSGRVGIKSLVNIKFLTKLVISMIV